MRLRHHLEEVSAFFLDRTKSTMMLRFSIRSPNLLSYLCRLFTSIDDCAERFKNRDYLWRKRKGLT